METRRRQERMAGAEERARLERVDRREHGRDGRTAALRGVGVPRRRRGSDGDVDMAALRGTDSKGRRFEDDAAVV